MLLDDAGNGSVDRMRKLPVVMHPTTVLFALVGEVPVGSFLEVGGVRA